MSDFRFTMVGHWWETVFSVLRSVWKRETTREEKKGALDAKQKKELVILRASSSTSIYLRPRAASSTFHNNNSVRWSLLIHFRVVVVWQFCPADILTYFLTCNLVVVQEFFRARGNAISRYNALTWLAKIWRPKSFFSSFCGGGSARGWKILILDLTSKREKTEESPIECNEILVFLKKLKRRGIYIAIVA